MSLETRNYPFADLTDHWQKGKPLKGPQEKRRPLGVLAGENTDVSRREKWRPPKLDASLMTGVDCLPGLGPRGQQQQRKPMRQQPMAKLSPWRAALAQPPPKVAIFDDDTDHRFHTPNRAKASIEKTPAAIVVESALKETPVANPPPMEEPVVEKNQDPVVVETQERDAEAASSQELLRDAEGAASAAALAAVRDAARLDATVKALGQRLVAAEHDRNAAIRREALEAVAAAEARLASAATVDALRESMLGALKREVQKARDDVVQKAADRFAIARSEYVTTVRDRDRYRRDLDDLKLRSARDLEKYQNDVDKLRAKHSARIETVQRENFALNTKANRLQASNTDLLNRLQDVEQENSRLHNEITDLRAISDELIAIAEAKHPDKQRPPKIPWNDSPSGSSISSLNTTKRLLDHHRKPLGGVAGGQCNTPGGLRDLTL